MPRYIGQPCTSCRSVFREGDDIVVCPECGSPYHKECYKNEGKCINTILHETGESWQPSPAAPEPFANENGQRAERVCGNCGTHNGADAYFCSGCGVALNNNPIGRQQVNPQGGQFGTQGQYGQQQYGGRPYGTGMNGMPPFLNVRAIDAETDIDGNTVGEYSDYVGFAKIYYYIPKFMRFAKTRNIISFNFAAFLFPHLWFAYRKMPLYSAITLVLSLILGIPSIIDYCNLMGVASFSWIGSATFIAVYNLCSTLSMILSVFCGIYANRLYYKKAHDDINRIKEACTESTERKTAILREGGVSGKYMAIAFGTMALFTFVVMLAIV